MKSRIAAAFSKPSPPKRRRPQSRPRPENPTEEIYQDEIVATENYYQKEDVDPTRLTLIEHEPDIHSETVGAAPPRADAQECQESARAA